MIDDSQDPAVLPLTVTADGRLRALFQELEKKPGLLQVSLGSVEQGILVMSAEGRLMRFNDRVVQLLDLPVNFLNQQPTLAEMVRFQLLRGDFAANDEAQAVKMREALALPEPQASQALMMGDYIRTTHSDRLVEVRTQRLRDDTVVRTFTDITGVIQEIAEREQTQSALMTSEEHLRLIAAQLPGMLYQVFLSSTGERRYTFISDGVRDIYGIEPEAVMADGDLLKTFRHPEDAVAVEAEVRASALSPHPMTMQFRLKLADGTVKWVQMASTVVQYEGGGAMRTGVMIDITQRKNIEAALRESEEMFRQVTAQIPGMVYRVTFPFGGTRRYDFVSQGVVGLYGLTPEAVMADGLLLETFRLPEDAGMVEDELAQASQSRLPMSNEFRIRLPDGRIKWVHITSDWIGDVPEGIVRSGVVIDITERYQFDLERRQTEERWKLALESTGDGMWDWHIPSGVERFSQRFVEMYGYQLSDFNNLAEEFDQLNHPEDIPQIKRDRQAHFDGITPTYFNEHRVKCKDGSWKWIMTRGMVIERDAAGKPVRMIGTHTDISQRKQSEAMIWHQANYDTLTGLPNRRMLHERIGHDILHCQQGGSRLAVLFIDLDHFKEVNDTLGHAKGDVLLIEAARRIAAQLGDHDTVARMGGDEFTVVLHETAQGNEGTVRVVQSILQAMATAFQLGEEQVFVSASIGITIYPQDATEVESLFKNADQALYVAKGAGRNRYSFYTPHLQLAALNRARLANDLRLGLQQQQFFMVYQPIVDLRTGAVRKAEALMRWQHPGRGLVSPAEFIPIAETSGLIIEMGDWAFRHVAAQAHAWRSTLCPEFQVSVNKSPAQFHHDAGSNHVWLNYLAELGLPGAAIAVEITEGLLLDVSEGVTSQLLNLHDEGVQVSLDDFGTGYSSLSYLQRFDIDIIKIDQSFVRHLVPESTDLVLCKAIIVMAHALGMKVVAEGIETEQQRDLLVAAGCDYGQGYWLARPMPASAFEAFLAAHHSPAAP
jgi:diguanylate cyclase (GGDEF)-like protein/PAS domain S-box-containing protein